MENHKRLYFKNGYVEGVTFTEGQIVQSNEKVMKGLFYFQYGYPLPQDYLIIIDWNQTRISHKDAQAIIDYLTCNFKWQHSGHPDMFRFILQPFRIGQDLTSTNVIPRVDDVFFAIMTYNRSNATIAVVKRNTQFIV